MSYEAKNAELRHEGLHNAKRRGFENMFLGMLTNDPRSYADMLQLDELSIKLLESHYLRTLESEQKWCYAVVGLPDDYVGREDEYKKRLFRCLKKCYVSKWYASFELGDSLDHPHWNILFKQRPKVLYKSRVIREFAEVFVVPRQYVNVDKKDSDAVEDIIHYMKKEQICFMSSGKDVVFEGGAVGDDLEDPIEWVDGDEVSD